MRDYRLIKHRKKRKKLIAFDKLFNYHNTNLNKKHSTFFFYNKKIHIVSDVRFKKKKPGHYQT